MIILHDLNGSWRVILDGWPSPSGDPNQDPIPVLTIPAGTTAHEAWQQLLAFCVANGVRVIPQLMFINPSGTTGTVFS